MKTEVKKENKDSSIKKWIIQVFCMTFILSICFSFLSTIGINKLSLFPAILLLLLVILMGVVFDVIGVAVTVANEHEFHAKASKKVHGSKKSITLIKNSSRVANICADVIGDICGVLSGAISALIAVKIGKSLELSFDVQFIMSAMVAAITVAGKAIGKEIATSQATPIIHKVGQILHKFEGTTNKEQVKQDSINKEKVKS